MALLPFSELNEETLKLQNIFATLKSSLQKDQFLTQVPAEARQAYFPLQLKDPILRIEGSKLNYDEMHTILIATINEIYSEEMFGRDIESFKKRFPAKDPSKLHEIKILPVKSNMRFVDVKGSSLLIEKVLREFPQDLPEVRIARLGPANSGYLYDAIRHILRSLKFQGQKKVHFITTGDTDEREILVLCRSLCIQKLCDEIQFYNVDYYTPFGGYKE